MDAKIMCNVYRCDDECTEHAYCDAHFEEKQAEAFEDGKKQGHDEGYEKGKADFETIN